MLIVGCSFESTSGQGPVLDPGQGSTTAQGSSGEADPSAAGSSSEGSTASDPDPQTSATPTTTAEETGDPGTTDSGTTDPGTTTTASAGSDTGAGEATVGGPDCAEPRVLSVLAEDAELIPPMQLGESMSVPYAYSTVANAGGAVFTFDVDCPSMYRLLARVRDDDPGTNSCCDPDSFVVQGPEGLDVLWFYGCDTSSAGWTWARVESGQLGQTCDDTVPILVGLTPGTHQFTLRNREPGYFDAVAGVAEVVLTNDPDYTP